MKHTHARFSLFFGLLVLLVLRPGDASAEFLFEIPVDCATDDYQFNVIERRTSPLLSFLIGPYRRDAAMQWANSADEDFPPVDSRLVLSRRSFNLNLEYRQQDHEQGKNVPFGLVSASVEVFPGLAIEACSEINGLVILVGNAKHTFGKLRLIAAPIEAKSPSTDQDLGYKQEQVIDGRPVMPDSDGSIQASLAKIIEVYSDSIERLFSAERRWVSDFAKIESPFLQDSPIHWEIYEQEFCPWSDSTDLYEWTYWADLRRADKLPHKSAPKGVAAYCRYANRVSAYRALNRLVHEIERDPEIGSFGSDRLIGDDGLRFEAVRILAPNDWQNKTGYCWPSEGCVIGALKISLNGMDVLLNHDKEGGLQVSHHSSYFPYFTDYIVELGIYGELEAFKIVETTFADGQKFRDRSPVDLSEVK